MIPLMRKKGMWCKNYTDSCIDHIIVRWLFDWKEIQWLSRMFVMHTPIKMSVCHLAKLERLNVCYDKTSANPG